MLLFKQGYPYTYRKDEESVRQITNNISVVERREEKVGNTREYENKYEYKKEENSYKTKK